MQTSLGLSDEEKRPGVYKSSPKLSNLWVSGHVHKKANFNIFGLKLVICRVLGSPLLPEYLF